jgi:hypothetical protein
MPTVRCFKNWPGIFHRTIAGERRQFIPGEPVDLTAQEFEAVKSDIGHSLELLGESPVVHEAEAELSGDAQAEEFEAESDPVLDADEEPPPADERDHRRGRRRR